MKMRVMEVSAPGYDNLKLVERPIPQPGKGEVQVRIRTATLNYRDALIVETGRMVSKMPYVPLSDACGVVSAVGEGVKRVRVGDRVAPTFFQNWFTGPLPSEPLIALGGPIDGVAREYACFPENGVVKIPDTLNDLEAATLPCAALTAWSALFATRATKPGDIVLLLGTGGVSIAGLQLSKAAGATVIITSSSDAKLARARSLGADHLINYRSIPQWGDRAREFTGGRGVDIVLEVGGAGTLSQSLAAVRSGGDMAVIGLLSGAPAQVQDPRVVAHQIHVGNCEQFEDMLRGIEAARIRPVVNSVFPLEKVGEALKRLRQSAMFGKIGIDIS